MAASIAGNAITDPTELFLEIGKLGKWIQAVGLVVIIWVVVQAITLYFNRKRRRMLEDIQKKVEKIDRKLDKIYRAN